MKTVAANVQILIGCNRSMAIALDWAEGGSQVEDGDFIVKLRKSAAVLGYSLTLCKPPNEPKELPKRPNKKAIKVTTPPTRNTLAQYLAEYIDHNEYKAQAGEVGALEEVITEGISAFESIEGVTVKAEKNETSKS